MSIKVIKGIKGKLGKVMERFEIHIPGRKREYMQKGQKAVIRIDAEAYNKLIDLADESSLAIAQIASRIINEAAERVVFDREEGGGAAYG